MKASKKTKVTKKIKVESTLDSFIQEEPSGNLEVKVRKSRKKKEESILAANAKKNANKKESDANIVTGETFLKGFYKKKSVSDEDSVNPNQDLIELGYEFTPLPSGKCNIGHKERFILNGGVTLCKFQGMWIRTIDSDVKRVKQKIKSLDFV